MQQTPPDAGALAVALAASAPEPASLAPATCPRAFLHGFAGTRAAWAPVVEALGAPAAQTHCLALPGHEAPLPGPPHTFAHAVDHLLGQLPSQPVHLIGYSLGARLALAMALTAPGRVRCLTLVGVQPGLSRPQDRQERLQHDQSWQRRLRQHGLVDFVRAWQAQPLFASQAHLPSERLQAQLQQRYSLHAEALADALGCLGLAAMPNYWPQLRRLQVPCALVVGALDTKFCRLLPRMVELLPHATAYVVPGVGHNVPLEAPQAMAERVRAHERQAGL